MWHARDKVQFIERKGLVVVLGKSGSEDEKG